MVMRKPLKTTSWSHWLQSHNAGMFGIISYMNPLWLCNKYAFMVKLGSWTAHNFLRAGHSILSKWCLNNKKSVIETMQLQSKQRFLVQRQTLMDLWNVKHHYHPKCWLKMLFEVGLQEVLCFPGQFCIYFRFVCFWWKVLHGFGHTNVLQHTTYAAGNNSLLNSFLHPFMRSQPAWDSQTVKFHQPNDMQTPEALV